MLQIIKREESLHFSDLLDVLFTTLVSGFGD